MLSRRVIAAGLTVLSVLALVCFAAVVDHLKAGTGNVRAGSPPACGCAPSRAGRTAPALAMQPPRQPAGFARPRPQGQTNQQRVADPSAKVDRPRQAVTSAASVSRPDSRRDWGTAQRQQSDGATLTLLEPGSHARPVEPSLKPAIVPVASADDGSGPAAFEPLMEVRTTRTDESVTGPDQPSATLDGRTVGRAVASTVVDYLTQGARSSLLLGQEGRGSLLTNSLDGIWAIGEQAALGLIVEGKLPERRALERQAVHVLAAAAQQEVAGSNGTASNLQTEDSISWTVDVTPSGQGAVELQIPAAVVTGGENPNESSNPTTVIFDSEAPSGYSASFLVGPIDDAAFEIGNAELGAAYSFTITSSGGGAPVTGSGTVGALQQQVTGLDLSGLGDGTLTLSVTLSDALENTGTPVTATMAKDSSAPVIVSITPPAAGLFNDL